MALYTIEPYPRTPAEVVAALFREKPPQCDRPAPRHKQVFASLDGKAAALRRLARWAAKRDGAHIHQRVALSDGAEALQNQRQAHLPDFPLVLDTLAPRLRAAQVQVSSM